MVQRDDLGYHRDILTRIKEYRYPRQLHAEDGRSLHVETGSLDHSVLIPLLELDHDFNALLLPDSTNPEDCRDIDQSHPAYFHVMPLQLVTAPDQDIVPAFARDDEIIRDQAVAALHEIEYAFRFTDAARPREKEPDPEHIGERAVERNRGSKFHLQHRLDPPVEFRRFQLGADERNSRSTGDFLEAGGQSLTLRHEHGGNGKGKKQLENLLAIRGAQRLEIGDLGFAEHLKSLRRESLNVSGQNQAGARHLGIADDAIESGSGLDLLELQRRAQPAEEQPDRYPGIWHPRSVLLPTTCLISRRPPPGAPAYRSPRDPR